MYDVEESEAFSRWLEALRDSEGRARVIRQVERMAKGNFGDCKSVGQGLSETRIDYGPGYRVYWMRRGERLIMLLGGGTKKRQQHDIEAAKALAGRI